MTVFSKFQLWHLKSINFSSHYHFQWFSGSFEPFFWKNGKKSEFNLFWRIFRKIALDKPKSHPETPKICQMASFRVLFDHIAHNGVSQLEERKLKGHGVNDLSQQIKRNRRAKLSIKFQHSVRNQDIMFLCYSSFRITVNDFARTLASGKSSQRIIKFFKSKRGKNERNG